MYHELTIDADPENYRLQILGFLNQFRDAVMLDSNKVFDSPVPVTGCGYDFIAAAGVFEEVNSENVSLDTLQEFLDRQQRLGNWVFGYLSYDLKNQIEKLHSANPDFVAFPVLHFFVPRHLFIARDNMIRVISKEKNTSDLWNLILQQTPAEDAKPEMKITYVQSRESYFEALKKILSHIRYGDIYELNYCQEIQLKASVFYPVNVYKKLTEVSPNPFSAYYKTGGCHLLCASPERFLFKTGDKIYSQPIKGTAARSADTVTDLKNKDQLRHSEKERSENVMIVDLVRNDLSGFAQKGSVKTEELFGVYTFSRSHQMISTVSCRVKPGVTFTDIIRAAFPMGSMTGAPKISAMKLIENYENFRRGVFSGTLGYIDPHGNFDFNVVIRSILYNEKSGNISVAAGGAITAASDPGKEYDETLLKLAPQLTALGLGVDALLDFNSALNHA